jgi:hypothetical protein
MNIAREYDKAGGEVVIRLFRIKPGSVNFLLFNVKKLPRKGRLFFGCARHGH